MCYSFGLMHDARANQDENKYYGVQVARGLTSEDTTTAVTLFKRLYEKFMLTDCQLSKAELLRLRAEYAAA